ncbi:MAG: phosphopantetheine-binding protein [Bacteroidetes bacterium]|nr:phosphopantetheine-binding protein [Bacteroidota bacterium]
MNTLNITDVKPEDIDEGIPLFGGGNALTLDSVDALEIIMAIQRNYQIRITDQSQARYTLRSINSIAEFIETERKNQHPENI